MDLKDFFRKHLLAILLVFIAVQLIIFALVQSHNSRPEAVADRLELIEGRIGRVSPLNNDVDKNEKDVINLATVSKPLHGAVAQKGSILIYTPEPKFVGLDSLAYTITDGKKESRPAYIVISVNKNLPPVANKDQTAVYSGSSTLIFPLDNDVDKEKDSMTISETSKPMYGELTLLGNKLLYKAGNNAESADSFYYIASDGKSKSAKTIVKINILKKSDPCYPWLYADIGAVSRPGKVVCSGGVMKVEASGTDIWNNVDGFFFIYQPVSGNCEMIAKVESLEGPHEWTKSGIMLRESLDTGSKNVFIGLTTKNGITSQARPEARASSENGERKSELNAPYWVKVARDGDSCKLAVSADGISWQKMQGGILPFASNVYLGIAVTSHDNSATCKTVLSHFRINNLPKH